MFIIKLKVLKLIERHIKEITTLKEEIYKKENKKLGIMFTFLVVTVTIQK